jgi:hypothetical protein
MIWAHFRCHTDAERQYGTGNRALRGFRRYAADRPGLPPLQSHCAYTALARMIQSVLSPAQRGTPSGCGALPGGLFG